MTFLATSHFCIIFAQNFLKAPRQGDSIYSFGGVFWRMGAAKLVEQGASYSEGYIRYPNGFRGFQT